MVKSKLENLILYLSVIFVNEDLWEKMVFKIILMVNIKVLCDICVFIVKYVFDGGCCVIDIWNFIV